MNNGWLLMAVSPSVVRRAVRVALVVGTVLIAINHGDELLRGEFMPGRWFRMVLTVLVPYCVSTYSSVSALRQRDSSRARLDS